MSLVELGLKLLLESLKLVSYLRVLLVSLLECTLVKLLLPANRHQLVLLSCQYLRQLLDSVPSMAQSHDLIVLILHIFGHRQDCLKQTIILLLLDLFHLLLLTIRL